MKASELRIKNLVQISDEHKNEIYSAQEDQVEYPKENYFEIASISKKEANLYILEEEFDFDLSDLKPIEITKEWLLRFGFEKITGLNPKFRDYEYMYRMAGFHLGSDFLFHYMSGNVKVEFVHELQNLYFALTKKELTLK